MRDPAMCDVPSYVRSPSGDAVVMILKKSNELSHANLTVGFPWNAGAGPGAASLAAARGAATAAGA